MAYFPRSRRSWGNIQYYSLQWQQSQLPSWHQLCSIQPIGHLWRWSMLTCFWKSKSSRSGRCAKHITLQKLGLQLKFTLHLQWMAAVETLPGARTGWQASVFHIMHAIQQSKPAVKMADLRILIVLKGHTRARYVPWKLCHLTLLHLGNVSTDLPTYGCHIHFNYAAHPSVYVYRSTSDVILQVDLVSYALEGLTLWRAQSEVHETMVLWISDSA